MRRETEAVGATALALAEREVEHLEQECPLPPVAPDRLVVSVDGAMVPLRGGEWAEMKLLSVGEPACCPTPAGAEPPVPGSPGGRTQQLSYFARLDDAETFGRQALGELHRRGLETAGAVAAVQDGAVWLQGFGFMDFHRPDALRASWTGPMPRSGSQRWPNSSSASTPHARAGPPTACATGSGAKAPAGGWLAVVACWERHQPALRADATSLRERQAHLQYPVFREHGWPVGSGPAQSGHTTVLQARLKRAGMQWAREQVNPLLALRVLECNGRWTAEGPALFREHRVRGLRQHRARQHTRWLARRTEPVPPAPPPPARPPAPHPWRRYGVPLSAKT